MLNIFLFPFHRFVIQFIQFWSPILFIYAPGSIHALMYFLLCCFTVIQCQLTLFNVGYLKDSEGQSVYTLQRYSPRPAGLPEKKGGRKKNLVKRNPQQWTQKKCTMLTVFQIPLIALTTMRESRRFLLSSTSTNNRLTKASQLMFCSETKPPRLSKCSYWRETKFFQLVHPFLKQKEKRELRRKGKWSLGW